MKYIKDKELENLVEQFEEVLDHLNCEYEIVFIIQLSRLDVSIKHDYLGVIYESIFTHTADIEEIKDRLANVLSKVLMEVI